MLFKKLFKAILIGILVFLFLSILLTIIVRYTAFSVEFCYYPMVAILAITTLIVSYLFGISIKKRGIIIGIASSILIQFIIIAIIESIFIEPFEINKKTILFIVPLFTGVTGAIIGVNNSK